MSKKDVIHFVNIGGDPTVLVNNTSYPLEIEELEDGDKAVTLDKYQTKPTRITDDELYSLSYDKKGDGYRTPQGGYFEKKYSRAIHAIAPNENSTATPVILTSGEASEGRKIMTRKDIVRLKKLFDKNKVPKAGVASCCAATMSPTCSKTTRSSTTSIITPRAERSTRCWALKSTSMTTARTTTLPR